MQPGTRLSHYEIGDLIGRGGMGEVWAAVDTRLGRDVALKFLPEAVTADAGRHARFHAEAQALAAFSHPHVAGIHSFEEIDGHHFLVMELVEGEDLAERLARGPLPEAEALRLARQIALALEAAHAKGIVHRDLKPANVKSAADGQVKVLDFGLAKIYGDAPDGRDTGSMPTVTSEMTAAGAILGTPAYMSPEQARGGAVDGRADIWAFGCVLYEMLAGKLAFPGDTSSDTLAAVLRAEPDWEALPAATSPGVRRLLRRCLSKDAKTRLHDVADARLEIDAVLAGEDEADAAATPAPAAGRRSRGLAALAVVGWLAAIALVVAGLRTAESPPPMPARSTPLTFSGRDWSPDASPDGTTIVFTSDRDGTPRIWLKQLVTGTEAPLTDGPDDHARFSPDGSQVLFVRDDGRLNGLYRQATLGDRPRRLMQDVTEADWSPSGDEVAFMRITPVDQDNLVSVGIADVQTGTERILERIENRLVYGIRWSPDGRRLSWGETSLTGNLTEINALRILDLESGEVRAAEIGGSGDQLTAPEWSPDGRSMVISTGGTMNFFSAKPSLAGRFFLEDGRWEPLFWGRVRTPRGGWSSTSIVPIDDHRIVYDDHALFAEIHLVPLRDGRPSGPERVLTTTLGHDRQPVVSPDGERILFASNLAGNVDIWEEDIASGDLRQITDDPASDWDPAYAPDGRQVLWSSDRGGHMEVWMANADGSGARQVTDDGKDAENPTMTPDGAWIVYASAGREKTGIWRIRPDGTEATLIAPGSNLLPEVSPDGRYALFVVVKSLDFVVEVVEIATGEKVDFRIRIPLVERDQDVVYGRARWFPDGEGIVYVGQDEDGLSGLYLQDFRPGEDTLASRRRLAGFSKRYDTESLGIAPDGSAVVFSAWHSQRVLKLVDDIRLEDW